MSIDRATVIEGRAKELGDANAEFIRFIGTCTDDEWARVCASEGWTVGEVANHIARGHEIAAGWIETIRSGRDVPGSPEEHDASNAAMAAAAAGVTRDDVARLAGRTMATLAGVLDSLTESDLAISGSFGPGGGMQMSVDRLAGSRRHLDGHLSSIRETLGR